MKKFCLIIIFLILAALFFSPIPCGRWERVFCEYKPGLVGHGCPKEGDIKFCPSLYHSLLSIMGVTNRQQAVPQK